MCESTGCSPCVKTTCCLVQKRRVRNWSWIRLNYPHKPLTLIIYGKTAKDSVFVRIVCASTRKCDARVKETNCARQTSEKTKEPLCQAGTGCFVACLL